MTTMIVFPVPPEGVKTHFMCGDESVYLRSAPSGLKCLAVDMLVLMPGCSDEQKKLAIEHTRPVRKPRIIGA